MCYIPLVTREMQAKSNLKFYLFQSTIQMTNAGEDVEKPVALETSRGTLCLSKIYYTNTITLRMTFKYMDLEKHKHSIYTNFLFVQTIIHSIKPMT